MNKEDSALHRWSGFSPECCGGYAVGEMLWWICCRGNAVVDIQCFIYIFMQDYKVYLLMCELIDVVQPVGRISTD